MSAGVTRPVDPALVPAEEEVRPPGLVPLVLEVLDEQRIDVAARLEWRSVEPQPSLLEHLAALAVVALLAGRDEVLPRVAAAAVTRNDVVQGEVRGLPAAVLAGV